jgi:hypothetical protein
MANSNTESNAERISTIDEFKAQVQLKFPNLHVKKKGKRFWTTDGSICFDTKTGTWHYSLAKSLGGSGSTLDEAIAAAEQAEGNELSSLYD